MSLGVSRTTEPLTFNTGIGNASFAEVLNAPGAGEPQKDLLPGSTTVTQAVDALFPTERAVRDEILSALVAGNTPSLRTLAPLPPVSETAAALAALTALSPHSNGIN